MSRDNFSIPGYDAWKTRAPEDEPGYWDDKEPEDEGEEERCRECGNTPETGACYYCKAD